MSVRNKTRQSDFMMSLCGGVGRNLDGQRKPHWIGDVWTDIQDKETAR